MPTEIDEVLRVVRQRTPLLMFFAFLYCVMLGIVGFMFALVLGIISSEARIETRQTQQEQQQSADARAFARFLQQFVGEQNYVCTIERIEGERLGAPAPAQMICQVATPAPTPAPR